MTQALAPVQHPYEAGLQPVGKAALLPTFSGRDMAEALTAYKDLQRALDQAMPDQIIDIRGKLFRKKGYWRAIRTAFNLSVECVKEESNEYGWRVIYRASAPNGRFADGDGACENEEKAEGNDTEHNVRSHAHTRAFNRAVSNLVGFGEVSAEECERGPSRGSVKAGVVVEPAAPVGERAPAPAGYVYIQKYWKEYEWHHVLLPDANGGSTYELKTKKPMVGETASQAFQQGTPVKVEGKDGKWLNKVIPYQAPASDAELDAEIARREMAAKAGEVL